MSRQNSGTWRAEYVSHDSDKLYTQVCEWVSLYFPFIVFDNVTATLNYLAQSGNLRYMQHHFEIFVEPISLTLLLFGGIGKLLHMNIVQPFLGVIQYKFYRGTFPCNFCQEL